jgi:carbon-monoxide dehydrogenase small subunit
MIMSAIDIVNRKGNVLDEQTIRSELEGNLCRCTGYHNIVKAVRSAAERARAAETEPIEVPEPPRATPQAGR